MLAVKQPAGSALAAKLGALVDTDEKRAFLVLMGATALRGLNTAQVKQQRVAALRSTTGDKVQKLPSAERAVDHPLVAWAVSNGTVLSLVALRFKVLGTLRAEDSNLVNFMRLWGGAILTVDGCMAISHVLINHVYGHVPFFSEKRPKPGFKELLMDYLSCNTVVNLVTSVLQLALFRKLRCGDQAAKPESGPFRPLRFLARMVWMRLWVDGMFWLGHWALHTKALYWVHKRHHEHNNPALCTNYHFSWQDLMVEAFLPFFAGVSAHEALIGPLSEVETTALAMYAFYHEITSHAGKPMPTMHVLPPLSPWLQTYDDRNCWAHEMHHNRLKCNYSISWYFDYLVGTDRWS